MAPQNISQIYSIRRSSPAIAVRSLSITRSVTPLSDETTLAKRLHCFKATLFSIREERRSIHRTARRTIAHAVKHTYKYNACGLCNKYNQLVTFSKFTNMSLREKFDSVIKYKYCVSCLVRSHPTQKCTIQKDVARVTDNTIPPQVIPSPK